MKKKGQQAAQNSRKKKIDILETLRSDGYDNRYTTVCNAVRDVERKTMEAFIRQQYIWGDCSEFDLRQG